MSRECRRISGAPKRPYSTKQEAKRVARSEWSRFRWPGERMKAYRCGSCGFYHIGHETKGQT